jgi:hypothetical protein
MQRPGSGRRAPLPLAHALGAVVSELGSEPASLASVGPTEMAPPSRS